VSGTFIFHAWCHPRVQGMSLTDGRFPSSLNKPRFRQKVTHSPIILFTIINLFAINMKMPLCAGNPVLYATDEELRTISEQIWAADANRLADSDVVYDLNGNQYGLFELI